MSLMETKNYSGPSREPCGFLKVTGAIEEIVCFPTRCTDISFCNIDIFKIDIPNVFLRLL